MRNDINKYKVLYIPSWIYKVLIRNQFNLFNLQKLEDLESILSVHDMSCLVSLNESGSSINDVLVGQCGIYNWFRSLNNSDISDIYNKYSAISQTEEIKNSLISRFTDVNGMTDDSYRLVINEYTLLVILPEGFIEKIKCCEYKLNYIRDVLKSLYSLASIKNITSSQFFEVYLKCLYTESKCS